MLSYDSTTSEMDSSSRNRKPRVQKGCTYLSSSVDYRDLRSILYKTPSADFIPDSPPVSTLVQKHWRSVRDSYFKYNSPKIETVEQHNQIMQSSGCQQEKHPRTTSNAAYPTMFEEPIVIEGTEPPTDIEAETYAPATISKKCPKDIPHAKIKMIKGDNISLIRFRNWRSQFPQNFYMWMSDYLG
ncbi:uncharacterized protein LOC130267700 isoform X2 [Hyla sarda]|uniref:uncharacterized protein LOC130267700 isoform X2 n=1 Tax=Hyla sarda TaxID=327740 RepID=UPI0024C21ED0|nr:uncharacterized protein LOC130267700 isoform X2 [Hyla sarda]